MTSFSMESDVRTEYHALRSTAGVHLLRRDVIRVSGPDAAPYLQGQCSQDVEALATADAGGSGTAPITADAGGSGTAPITADALLLSPQGKIDAYLRITRLGDDEFILDTDEGFGEVAIARLERFRLRVKVEFELVPWVCMAIRGPAALGAVIGRPLLVLPVEWPGLAGVDLLGPGPDGGLSEWVGDQAVRCGDPAWEAARIEAGIPVNGREVTEGSIAAEVGLVDRTVSFIKGCFTGQELVARIDSRGSNVARRLRGVVIEDLPATKSVPVGAGIWTADQEHQVGHLSSVAWSPGSQSSVALATLHRRVTPPESVLVRWEDAGGPRTVHAMALPLPLVV
jgi:tRNA-modifying protein YgfZ